MCGRFALVTEKKILELLFELELREELAPRFNIAPSQAVLAVRFDPARGAREAAWLKWGLVPAWARDETIGPKLINARAETLAEKPSFRDAFLRRRALIPASGFFEWQKDGPVKQPFYIRLKDETPFALGALWERRAAGEGEQPLETCAIITTAANGLLAPLHDRMPVIIGKEAFGRWLDPGTDPAALRLLLQPFPEKMMTAYPVSRLVNNPANDLLGCLAQSAPQAGQGPTGRK
jgi:putative SOS response-associated peptidase YedK